MMKIAQIFVAFSEKQNFIYLSDKDHNFLVEILNGQDPV